MADFDHLGGIADEVVGELADVDESVLMDADIDECAKSRDVGDNAGKFHADLEVVRLFDAVLEREQLELLAGIATRLGEFGDDVAQGRQADIGGDVFGEIELLAQFLFF